MEYNGKAGKINGNSNGNSHNGHVNGNGSSNNGKKDIYSNSYPTFILQNELTEEQKDFLTRTASFISRDFCKRKSSQLLSEARKYKMIGYHH